MFSPMGLNLKPKMMTEKSGEPSTAMEHLLMFEDDPAAKEFVSIIKAYASASKTMNTYVRGFQKHIRSDGKFHPSYWFFVGKKDEDEGGTNCMPAGELVLTSRGYLPVEQVQVGDQVISHKGRARPVIKTVLNGIKPIVKVTMSNGLVLRTTPNHAYHIGGGWVEAGNLSVGMQAWAHSGVEEWEPIQGWEDFQVSSWGRVFNVKTKRMVTQYPKGKWGHLKVMLRRNGAQKRGEDRKDFTVHRLVADAFVEKFGGVEVRHLNGFAWDNTASNLEWGTSQENRDDSVSHGTMSRREGSQAKLSEEAVAYIRSLPRATRVSGVTNEQLSTQFGVCERLIRAVRAGKRWQPTPPREKKVEFKPVFVTKVEFEDPEMTYGLTVEEDHSHVTGGLVTHNTGRLSCKDPAFQTIPKHTIWGKRIRRCFPAPPGYVVCERDYSQGELKVIACVANEENMIQAYLQDMDLHSLTAGPFRGYEYEDMMAMKAMEDTNPELFHLFEEIRQLGKAGNFGLIYGMGADGFYDYAINNYGVKNFFRSDADKFRTGFFLRYPQLPDYHDEYKKFARKHGFVRSPLGRVRHLPLINSPMQDIRAKAERQAINAPIQGTLSDMLLWSAAIAQANGWTEVCPAFGAIHDALYNYIPEDNVEMYVKRELDSMQNLPFHKVGWKPRLVFTADAKIGKNMADLKKLKLAA
jgi:hypothetical protein